MSSRSTTRKDDPPSDPGADARPTVETLSSVYWRHVPEEELAGRGERLLVAAVAEHLELGARRVPGEIAIRVGEDSAGAEPYGVVQIVTDDMPFLVDSVTAELARVGVGARLFVHPQLVVRRDAMGALLSVKPDADPDTPGAGDMVESWMRIEIDEPLEDAAAARLREDLRRVLTDVRDAVSDWEKMRDTALSLASELESATLPVPDKDVSDSRELLRWLVDHHFTFLGYREYALTTDATGTYLKAVLGTGLGILRSDASAPRSLDQMAPEVRARLLEKRLLIITKANSRATVHRPSYLDYIGLKTFDAAGNVVGEKRFLGLFSSTAYLDSVRNLPVISRKVEEVLDRAGLSLRSHSGKDLLQILETYPRDELFQIRTDELYDTAMSVMRLTGRRELRLFVRKDLFGRFVSCLVYLPRDRYTTRNRHRMQEILVEALHGIGVDYTARVTEGVQARVRFVVRTDPAAPPGDIDIPALQARLIEVTRLWEEDFAEELSRELGHEAARELRRRYGFAFGEGYKAERTPTAAVDDVARIESLDERDEIAVHLEPSTDRGGSKGGASLRFTVYRRGEAMSLSAVLPVLQSLGVEVIDERPYRVSPSDAPAAWIYDFGLAVPDTAGAGPGALDDEAVRLAVENAFVACWRGESEVDGFNALVPRAGLTWQQVVVLRAYAKYLRQAGTVYSQQYMESTLAAHPHVARMLVRLFEARFDPAYGGDAEAGSATLVGELTAALDEVSSLDQDRIIRSYLTLIQATLRTNHYQRTADGRHKTYLSLKLDPAAIPDLPKPRPKFEIFVYSARVEGVHLRFGAVARGGLRWSDRLEDFRTEVLGLVKAQMVKNTIIVPVGSKGGFVVKRPPAGGDRAAVRDEGVACYELFISGLLDVTDNMVGGKVVPPADVVRHDGDDPYLVVAADKGTATFSDIANAVARSYDFWLGDAFASGGSAGYDHKKMGITARGAWESVKRHFREIGVDTQTQDFTVVGVGDMSGDVFGNGMLLSEHIRLVAAFDHRHVFLDPDPDAARSFAERQRLFALPASTWDDYDRSLISAGGGVWPRTAKSIPLSPQVRTALGLDETVERLSPPELIQAILRAPVDLLWNGGIGTYVKASTETNAEVGDKSNDALRVDGASLRCKVVGEGGNLGLTQRGRVEYALAGGRVNTDAIDNSAGVDTSDHEVNIKILLGQAVESGELTLAQRDELLVAMTDEVAELVLRDNYDQNNALALSTHLSAKLFSVHRRMLSEMERAGRLDRAIEFLPSESECAQREAEGRGLTQPELAVLLAYVKIGLADDVLASNLPDESWCADVLVGYFPTPLRERFRRHMETHPLRREIITTLVVNEMVNHGGISYAYRAMEETGASAAEVARAYVVVREVLGLSRLWADTHALDNVVPTSAQLAIIAKVRRILDRGVRWLLQSRGGAVDVPTEIKRLEPGVSELIPKVAELFVGDEAATIIGHVRELTELGIPAGLAKRTVGALYGFGLFDVVELANRTGEPPAQVAAVYYSLSNRFHMDELFERITQLPRSDRWTTLARMAVRYDLYGVLATITAEVLNGAPASLRPQERVSRWLEANAVNISRVENTLAMLNEDAPADLATISVLLRQMRTLV